MNWNKPEPKISAKDAAINLLSRRDHGEYELKQKLSLKGYQAQEIENAVIACYEYGYINDFRYAQIQVRSHLQKGHGLRRIVQSLKQKQIDDNLIEQALNEQDIDWFEQAKEMAMKKFKGQTSNDPKVYAKKVRFLQYRGFDFEQIKYALSDHQES